MRIGIAMLWAAAALPAMTPQAAKCATRMPAAITPGPGGNIFVKFTGPAGTGGANRAKFDQLVSSVQKE